MNDDLQNAAPEMSAKEAKKVEKERLAKERAEAKAARVVQNGQPMPGAGTIGAKLWDIFDETSTALQRPAKLSECLEKVTAAGIKTSSATAGYAHWRKFYGLTKAATAEAKTEEETPAEV